MATILQHCSHRTVGIDPYWTNLPLLQIHIFDLTSEVTTSVEFESPSSLSPPIEVEMIDESHFPNFNPPLPSTFDFILHEFNVTVSVPISPH